MGTRTLIGSFTQEGLYDYFRFPLQTKIANAQFTSHAKQTNFKLHPFCHIQSTKLFRPHAHFFAALQFTSLTRFPKTNTKAGSVLTLLSKKGRNRRSSHKCIRPLACGGDLSCRDFVQDCLHILLVLFKDVAEQRATRELHLLTATSAKTMIRMITGKSEVICLPLAITS